ncbi:MAG TPA: hypothetical protein VGM77_08110 [Gemmatimonadales bacterium]|jgi:hypothetical protein
MNRNGSKLIGAVLTMGLTVAGLTFLVGMVGMSKQIDSPMPLVGLVFGGLMFGALWFGPVGRALGRMLDTRPIGDEQMQLQIDQLESRVLDAGVDQQRLAELEERLDFAERLLAQRNAPELQRYRTPT